MFTDSSCDYVGIDSSWETERELKDEEVQTANTSYEVQESQTYISTDAETQTDNLHIEMMAEENVDYDKLTAFLRYVGPLVSTELDKCDRSRAFDSYEPLDDDIDGMVKKLHDIQIPSNFNNNSEIYVSSLTWFSTGTVIACSYCYISHEDWCDHSSWVQLFNINKSSTPSRFLEVGACVTALSAHPFEPSILAAGLYDGKVVVWNLQRDDASLIGVSTVLPAIHREHVTQVSWINNTDAIQNRPLLASSGSDGRIMLWKVEAHAGISKLSEAFIITLERIRYLSLDMYVPSPVGIEGRGTELGINCFSFSLLDPTCFIVGIDGGILLCCSTISAKPAPVDADIPLKDPILRAFDRHQGAIISVKCSPHRDDTFISCATDKEIRMYSTKQPNPRLVIHVANGIGGLEWSLAYSHIVATWGNDNSTVEFYNLQTKQIVPYLQIPSSGRAKDIATLSCNKQNYRLIATGDICGRVTIWQQTSYRGD